MSHSSRTTANHQILNHAKLDAIKDHLANISSNTTAIQTVSDTLTHTKLDSGNSLLTSIDSSLSGVLSVSGSFSDTTTHSKLDGVNSNLSGLGTESTLSSIDTTLSSGTLSISGNVSDTTTHSKLDGVNSNLSGLGTESTLSSIDTTLSSGTIRIDPIGTTTQPTEDSTTHSKLDGVNSNLSGLATQATLASIEGSHYANGDAIAGVDTGILIMGRDNSNNAHPVHITQNGDVEVEIADMVKGQALMASSFPVVISSDQSVLETKAKEVENLGSFENVANNITLNIGSSTTAISIANYRKGNLFYSDTSTTSSDGLSLLVSPDGTNFFKHTDLYPFENTPGIRETQATSLSFEGLTHAKIENTSSIDNYSNVKCSLVGAP